MVDDEEYVNGYYFQAKKKHACCIGLNYCYYDPINTSELFKYVGSVDHSFSCGKND